jgi:hypothetical protein
MREVGESDAGASLAVALGSRCARMFAASASPFDGVHDLLRSASVSFGQLSARRSAALDLDHFRCAVNLYPCSRGPPCEMGSGRLALRSTRFPSLEKMPGPVVARLSGP